jgi:DNA-binding MltR family transcriptional regulator
MSSRGIKKPKLRDLSVDPLTSVEIDSLLSALDASLPPIALAILGQVLLEHELDQSLRLRLPRRDDKTWASMLDERGPLSTFSRKISVAHALKIIDDGVKANMDIIRVVRNAFAHSRRLIDFNHPLVVAELNKIVVPNYRKRTFAKLKTDPNKKHVYLMMCMIITGQLLKRQNKSRRAADRRKHQKIISSPLYRLLAPSLGAAGGFSPAELRLNQLSPPLGQSGGPNPPILGGLLAGLHSHFEPSMSLANLGKKK